MSEPRPEPKARFCALCSKPQEEKFRPFCSKRCADLDLGKWLSGTYVLAGDELPNPEGAGAGFDDEES